MFWRTAKREDPIAVVWRRNVLLEQGLVVLGVPVGRPEHTLAKLEAKSRKHNILLDRITSVADLQSGVSCFIAGVAVPLTSHRAVCAIRRGWVLGRLCLPGSGGPRHGLGSPQPP